MDHRPRAAPRLTARPSFDRIERNPSRVPASLDITTDIVYRAADERTPDQALDVLVPRQRFGRQVVIYLHGGGWRAGSRDMSNLPAVLAEAGVTVIRADYALTSHAPYPRNIDDVFALLDYVVTNADALDVDPHQIFLSGSSSGAHLSSLAVTKGLAEGRLTVTPAGVISWYSPLDPVSRYLTHRYPATHYPGSFWARGAGRDREQRDLFRPLIGTDDFSTVTLRDALDPDPRFHLDRVDPAALPPFLLFVGTRDSDEIRNSQLQWFGALKSVGADVELLTAQNADHSDADFSTPATLGAALGFIHAHS
jgi:acetyl esterase/lipase